MPTEAFRFVHSADFHLERALYGLSEIPESLREVLVDAPMLAAEQVFEAAIANRVDFMVLAGDILDPLAAGPRACRFLSTQFERLDAADIFVYWCAGKVDQSNRLAEAVQLPANVHLFSAKNIEAVVHQRDLRPLATIIGLGNVDSKRINFTSLPEVETDEYKIAIGHGRADSKSFAKADVDYWALGGRHELQTDSEYSPTIHYPGVPQGRCPTEAGTHGCSLVSVGAEHQTQIRQVETNLVRWRTESIQLESVDSSDATKDALGEQMLNVVADAQDVPQLVSWKIEGPREFTSHRNRRPTADELTKWLRDEFADTSPVVWTVAVAIEPPTKMPNSWRKEETILGDFLRVVQQLQNDSEQPIKLDGYLSGELADSLSSVVSLTDSATRKEVLKEATMLGVNLLRGSDAA